MEFLLGFVAGETFSSPGQSTRDGFWSKHRWAERVSTGERTRRQAEAN